jgi:hypothetical protein
VLVAVLRRGYAGCRSGDGPVEVLLAGENEGWETSTRGLDDGSEEALGSECERRASGRRIEQSKPRVGLGCGGRRLLEGCFGGLWGQSWASRGRDGLDM